MQALLNWQADTAQDLVTFAVAVYEFFVHCLQVPAPAPAPTTGRHLLAPVPAPAPAPSTGRHLLAPVSFTEISGFLSSCSVDL